MAARKPAPAPVCIGDMTENTPFGPITVPIAPTIQRYLTRKGQEMWRVRCPRCGRIHEHEVGSVREGGRGAHCGAEVQERGDYWMTDGSHLPLIPNVREADAELRGLGWL